MRQTRLSIALLSLASLLAVVATASTGAEQPTRLEAAAAVPLSEIPAFQRAMVAEQADERSRAALAAHKLAEEQAAARAAKEAKEAEAAKQAKADRAAQAARQAERAARRAALAEAGAANPPPQQAAPPAQAPPPPPSPSSGGIRDKIANCEGGARYLHSDHGPASTASGKYGFLDSTWDGLDAKGKGGPPDGNGPGWRGYRRAMDAPEEVQDAAFDQLWAGGAGASHWRASRGCWG